MLAIIKKLLRSVIGRKSTGILLAIGAAVQTASGVNLSSVTLAWDPSPDSWVSGYAVQYGTVSGSYTVRLDVGPVTTATVTNLMPGVTYYFVVTAYTSDGLESLPSNEVSYTVPAVTPDTPLVIANLTLTTAGARVAWATVPGATYQLVYKDDFGDSLWLPASLELVATNTQLSCLDATAGVGSRRFYAVVLVR
jgi:hypothetical protein